MLVIGMVLRWLWFPVMTSDYIYFIRVWFDTLQTHAGLSAFAQPFANYAPLYLYALKALTTMTTNSLYSAKLLSTAGDIAVAALAAHLVVGLLPQPTPRSYQWLYFTILLSVPTFMINSALWGQSDTLYALPVLGTLYFMFAGQPLLAAITFGIALSVKVQAIFFLPIFIGFIWQLRNRWRYLVIPPVVYTLTVIPVIFGGGNFWYWFFIYLTQAGEYPYLSVSAPSIFAFADSVPLSTAAISMLFWAGIALALMSALVVGYLMSRTSVVSQAPLVILLCLASVLAVPYFLPRMHERYFYLADLFSVLYALVRPHRWFLPVLIVSASLLAYMPYLSSQVSFLSGVQVDLRIPSALLLVSLYAVVYEIRLAWRPSARATLGRLQTRVTS